jgi:hypothetical protein
VDEHLATLGEAREGQDTPYVAARDHPRRLHHAVVADPADEADLPPLGEPDSCLYRECCFGGESIGGHGTIYRTNAGNGYAASRRNDFQMSGRRALETTQVFSGFFLAAGKRTLFRISR